MPRPSTPGLMPRTSACAVWPHLSYAASTVVVLLIGTGTGGDTTTSLARVLSLLLTLAWGAWVLMAGQPRAGQPSGGQVSAGPVVPAQRVRRWLGAEQ